MTATVLTCRICHRKTLERSGITRKLWWVCTNLYCLSVRKPLAVVK